MCAFMSGGCSGGANMYTLYSYEHCEKKTLYIRNDIDKIGRDDILIIVKLFYGKSIIAEKCEFESFAQINNIPLWHDGVKSTKCKKNTNMWHTDYSYYI